MHQWKGGGGGGAGGKKIFSGLLAAVWSNSKGGLAPPAPPLDLPLYMLAFVAFR